METYSGAVVNPVFPSQNQSFKDRATRHLLESAEVKRKIAEQCLGPILDAVETIVESFRQGGKVLLCGNGGSAADCQHMAAELVSRLTTDFDRPGLPAIALTTDTSVLTAYANDCGFDGVFARQVEALGKPGDILIGISTSGNSNNVLQAMSEARKIGLRTIGLVGEGGRLAEMVDCAVVVPSRDTHYIQEGLLSIEHVLCCLVEKALFGQPSLPGTSQR